MENKASDAQKGLTTKIHLVCTSAGYAFVFFLSAGNCHDAQGRKLLDTICSEDEQYLPDLMKMIKPVLLL